MIPTLKEEEKAQIMAWLVEAREFAMDAEIQIRNMLLSVNTKAGLIITSLSGDMI